MKRTHGLSATRVYKAWHGIKQRLNPNWRFYGNYGGRGIRACLFIRESLDNFISLMGDCPEGYTLDRKDNNGHYSCGSCSECKSNEWPMNLRWATRKEQSRNRRTSKFITIDGVQITLAEAAERVGVSIQSIFKRVKIGRTGSDIMSPRHDSIAMKNR